MVSLINEIIGPQGFEKVRDAIGAILKVELENQKVGQDFDEGINLWVNRMTPFGDVDNLNINVLLDSANYSGKTQISSQGYTTYFVDVYTTGVNKLENNVAVRTGSTDSSFRLHRFLGMIRYILSHTKYNKLGFEPGLIGGTMVDGFIALDESTATTHLQDGSYTCFGRISFSVRILENQDAWEAVQLDQMYTTVHLEETEKGYIYVMNDAA